MIQVLNYQYNILAHLPLPTISFLHSVAEHLEYVQKVSVNTTLQQKKSFQYVFVKFWNTMFPESTKNKLATF